MLIKFKENKMIFGKVQKEKVKKLRSEIKSYTEHIDRIHKSLAVFQVDCEHLPSEHFENIKNELKQKINRLNQYRDIAWMNLDRYRDFL